MNTIQFSKVHIGDELPVVEHFVSQDVIDAYAVSSLDYNPVHTNVDWCTRAQVFGMPCTVGHGMFTMSLMSSVVVRAWGAAHAHVRSIEVKFTKPVPVGTLLRCTGKVKELHPIAPGKNFAVVELSMHDPADHVMAVGSAQVMLPD
jgi:phosphate acetyltransferase